MPIQIRHHRIENFYIDSGCGGVGQMKENQQKNIKNYLMDINREN